MPVKSVILDDGVFVCDDCDKSATIAIIASSEKDGVKRHLYYYACDEHRAKFLPKTESTPTV